MYGYSHFFETIALSKWLIIHSIVRCSNNHVDLSTPVSQVPCRDHSIAAIITPSNEASNAFSESCLPQHLLGQSSRGSARVFHQHEYIHTELLDRDIVHLTHLFGSDVDNSGLLFHALTSP